MLTAECEGTDGLCGESASATVSTNGGASPYIYLWSNGGTTATISGLGSGTYSVVVTDANGCQADCSVEVDTSIEPLVDILCEDDQQLVLNGSQTVENTVNCTNGPYAFWSNTLVNAYTSEKQWSVTNGSFVELTGGTAQLTATYTNNSDNSLVFEASITFSGRTFTPPANSPKKNDVCVGDLDNTDWYYYTQTDGTLIGQGALAGAVVHVSRFGEAFQIGTGANLNVANEYGASAWLDFEVLSQPSTGGLLNVNSGHCDINFALNGGPNLFNVPDCTVLCAGESATLVASALAGNGSYTYLWSPGGETTASITVSPLVSTTYTVIVTSDGCTAEASIDLTVNDAPEILCSSENGQCGTLGSATVSVLSGTGPYTYAWSNDETTVDISELTDGTYTVTVTDANGCNASCEVEIANEPALTVNCSIDEGPCGELASATATPSGGASPYTYLWSNGGTTAIISELSSGTYSVMVTDANGCEGECEVIIEPSITPLVDIVCDFDPTQLFEGDGSVTNVTGCYSFGYAFWTNNLLSAYNVNPHWWIVDGSFVENPSGSAFFTGSFVNNEDPNLSFDFNVVFGGRTYTAPAGSPKETGLLM